MTSPAISAAPPVQALGVAILIGDRAGVPHEAERLLQSAGFRVSVRHVADGHLRVAEPVPPAALVVLLLSGATASRLATIAAVHHEMPSAQLLATMPDDASAHVLRRALRAGAHGLLLDGELPTALVPSAIAVAAGRLALPDRMRVQVAPLTLSHREREVLALAISGLTNRQIADRLYLAESTVKSHLSSTFTKLGVGSRAEAAAMAHDPEDGPALGLLTAVAQP